jgi:hypothetical protein
MREFVKFITVKNAYSRTKMVKRMVNQEEITEYVKHNPGKTENQIMENVYGYYRNDTWESNKKYADCLRRALHSNKISRIKSNTKEGIRYIYFAL